MDRQLLDFTRRALAAGAARAEIAAALRAADPTQSGLIPADLATASASGLDPDISPEAARYQVARVAKARELTQSQVAALIKTHTAGPLLGLWGRPRVNVLELNLALDALAKRAR